MIDKGLVKSKHSDIIWLGIYIIEIDGCNENQKNITISFSFL